MKTKNLLLMLAATVCLTAVSVAQVPSYVPTDGLVGWWPFNGNANDESGNGNNGMVNGATLAEDRFGNVNAAFSFNSVPDRVEIGSTLNPTNYMEWQIQVGLHRLGLTGTTTPVFWHFLTTTA
ncbi:MAG: hypothetical protein ACKOW8_06310 [Flavobacteriales bacterium]